MATRRNVLRAMAGALGATLAGRAGSQSGRPARRLDLLVLGGTGFIGPALIREALVRGHRVTMFNRGRSAPGLYGREVETLIGNRDSRVDTGLAALEGRRRWDVVIDNSGYLPRHVRDSAGLLKDRVARYVYVSTVSVYPLGNGGPFDERSGLHAAPPADAEQVTAATYGPLKAACDRVAREIGGERATVVRPTYIVGPGDDTDRFTYWVDRVARGGDVLSPPDPGSPLQWIDVRDLGRFLLALAEQDTPGIFNAASAPAAWADVLQALATAARRSARFRRSTPELLERFRIDLPLVAPDELPWTVSTAAAEAAGLAVRPLVQTARDTLEWWNSQPAQRRANPSGWPSPETEQAALKRLWRV